MNAKLHCLILVPALLSSPSYALDTAIPFVHVDEVHALGILGQGVVVAVLDEGVDYGHPELAGKTAPRGRTYLNGNVTGGEGAPDPGYDHGTFVALEIVSPGAYVGVAPAARILPVRVLHDLTGTGVSTGTWLDIRKGIEYVTRQRQPGLSPGIRVINMSLGGGAFDCPCDNTVTDPDLIDVRNAIRNAKDAGILTVVATGNDSQCWTICAPACFSDAVAVAASYDDANYPSIIQYWTTDPWGNPVLLCQDVAPQPLRVTCFSNYDWCLGGHVMAAPGYDIDVGGFYDWDGTSMATPIVAGVAALRYSRYGCRAETPDAMRMLLITQGDLVPYPATHCPALPPVHVNALKTVTYTSSLWTEPGTGDMDCDGSVCGYDFPPFAECMTGPGGGPVMGFCLEGDFGSSPPDGDVDLRDLYSFELAFEGFGRGACCDIASCLRIPVR